MSDEERGASTAEAILAALTSGEEEDQAGGAANAVDGLFAIARAVDGLAAAVRHLDETYEGRARDMANAKRGW